MSEALAVLRRIRAGAAVPRMAPGEACELCGEPIADGHGHLVDLERRAVLCSCRGCFLLFTPGGAGGQRFRAVPDRYVDLGAGRLTPDQWEALQVPVGVAFFFRNSTIGTVAAFYPSPAGATESLLPLAAWDDMTAAIPEVAAMLPDVEALLVRVDPRTGASSCYVVPIDACYQLVGELRRLWKGFDGGREARVALDDFFAGVARRAGAP